MDKDEMMTVKEAAKRMRVGTQKIRTGIISKDLPIGWAIKEKNCYSFIIPRQRFEACMSGTDLIYVQSMHNENHLSQKTLKV